MTKASINDKKLIIDILCSSFAPIKFPNSINFIIGSKKNRSKRLKILMNHIFENCFSNGEIFLSQSKKSCLLIEFPHLKKFSYKTLFLDVKLIFYCIGFKRLLRVLKRERLLKSFRPKTPHIHPVIVATFNESNGRGDGVRLMKKVIQLYSTNKLPIIIETTTKTNVRIYESLGFKVRSVITSLNYPLYILTK